MTSLTPILKPLLQGSLPSQEGQLKSETLFHKVSDFEGSGSCLVNLIGKKQKQKAYCKVTHLLDPIRTIQKYYEHPEKGLRRKQQKSENPMNQAYVDALGNYVLGQLREKNISPHFCLYYGGYRATAEKYRYNITDEFESYRKYSDFWDNRKMGIFSIHVSPDSEDEWFTKTPTSSSMRSTRFSYTTPRNSRASSRSHISLDGEVGMIELESIHSISDSISNSISTSSSLKSELDSESESDSESDSDSDSEKSVYVELRDYPVMLIFQEEMEGVLDDLLEDEPSDDWEEKWTAWTFQIIAALCAAQGVLGFTHNDLHTNNIVWSETKESWLFYKNRDGTVWRVPTFGKIFRIIDFGRSIFRIGEELFVSDDYELGGDADGQYNFGSFEIKGKPIIYPNPSFDLCRYAVSIIDAVFPEMPVENLDGLLLSKEDSWEIRETVSPLWNLLWSWLVDDNLMNVLKDENDTERFPDFDLYSHIAANVHGAKPQEQIVKEIFNGYKVAAKDLGEWETVYPLFC